jgi:hypothetical protein
VSAPAHQEAPAHHGAARDAPAIDPAALRAAHAAAVADLRASLTYALPVPTSHEVLAHLRRGGHEHDRFQTLAACVRAGLALADAPAPGEACGGCGRTAAHPDGPEGG